MINKDYETYIIKLIELFWNEEFSKGLELTGFDFD